MKVRLIEEPSGWVVVEFKRHWFSSWSYKQSFHGDNKWNNAKEYAVRFKNPAIEYIE